MVYYVYMMDLLKKLEIYRLEHKMSQRKLAKILGISYNTVNRWFMNRNIPNKIQQYHIKKLIKDYNFKDKHFEIT